MISYIENGIHILEPENDLWLTNGETYSKKVFLGKNANESDWEEVEWDGTYPDDEISSDEALDLLLGGDSE